MTDDAEELEQRRERIRRAQESLRETLRGIIGTYEERKGERCPYRSATDVCTYRGGCVNKQRMPDGTKKCGGDHKLKWGKEQP
jgi:hypothetical protein